jgi:acyl carrier protein
VVRLLRPGSPVSQWTNTDNIINMEDIINRLNNIFRDVFADSSIQVNPGMTAADVEKWDSLSHLTMIAAVEKEFGIKFKLKELVSMKNVGDLITAVQSKITA